MTGRDEQAAGPPVQMRLPFPVEPRYDRAAFQASASNNAALTLVERWPDWPSHAAAIYADSGAGKTHLAHIWAARARAVWLNGTELGEDVAFALTEGFAAAVDDADAAARTGGGGRALFHLLNRAQQERGWVLLTGRSPPSQWMPPLPDLLTRLSAMPSIRIEPPDDALLAAVLSKSFADRQMRATPALIAFVVARMERDLAAAERLVQALDRASLEAGKTLSFELADRLIAAQTRD